MEFGQPHLFDARAAQLLDLSELDRVNGSLHTLQIGADRSEPNTLFRLWPADKVIWAYLAEVPRMAAGSDSFEVFTHIDYAVRFWPTIQVGPFDPKRFEEGFRNAMRLLADSGRALEMNTRRLWSWIPQWWSEEGGRAVTFGSDALTCPARWPRTSRKRWRWSSTMGFGRDGARRTSGHDKGRTASPLVVPIPALRG
ncbi:MAG: hypothetical protein ACR2FF_08145 [Mycobacteriales bacterium]